MRYAPASGLLFTLAAAGGCADLSGLNAYANCGGPCDGAILGLDSPTLATGGDADRARLDAESVNGGEAAGGDAPFDSTVGAAEVEPPPRDATVTDAAQKASSADARAPIDAGSVDAASVDASLADVAAETGVGGPDAEAGSPIGAGPACLAADGGFYQCNGGQHCCVNAATAASQCATSCVAPEYAVDCSGSTNTSSVMHQCGSQACCGTLTLGNGVIPNCSATMLESSCTSSCNDSPPVACNTTSTIHLCWATADCASASPGNTVCCKFGSSPVYWCVDPTIALTGQCM
jgi:hypothetical protein